VVLIGDAAHAMPPSLAQGASQALEDAWVLARELDRHPAARLAIEVRWAASLLVVRASLPALSAVSSRG
jgi:salicylate hydroxylase